MSIGRLFGPAVLIGMLSAAGAAAQTFEQALDGAGKDIVAALNRQEGTTKAQVGIAPFMGEAGVVCEPLSSILSTALRRKLIDAALSMGSPVEVVETLDAATVKAVVSGRWIADAGDMVRLTLTLGDVTDMRFRDIALTEATFAKTSLPPDSRRCILDLDPIEQEVTADRALLARASPSPNGAIIGRVEPGAAVWVAARVLSEGADDWFVVRLPPDQTMPMGMRERKGFAYRVPLPRELQHRFKVEDADATFGTLRLAAVRADPLAGAAEVARLPAAKTVHVTGKVVERNWYRIAWRDGQAYVFGDLVQRVDPGEAADWEAVDGAKRRDGLTRFLGKWPKSPFAGAAKSQLAALGPPPLEVKAWTERRSYRAGDVMKVFIEGNRDFYAQVVYIDATGACVSLLPNLYRRENRFRGGTAAVLPAADDRYELAVGAPFGRETIHVFASTAPIGAPGGQDIGAGLTRCPGTVAEMRGLLFRRTADAAGGGAAPEQAEATVEVTTEPEPPAGPSVR